MSNGSANRVCRFIFHTAPLTVAAFTLVLSVAINFANVIGRYFFQSAIYWAEEAMIYLAIWSVFLAAIAIAYEGADLTMDLFFGKLRAPWRRTLEGAMTGATVAICLFMSWQSWKLIGTLMRNGQNSLALEIPLWIPQSSLLFGFTMIAAASATRFFLRLGDAAPLMTTQPGAQT